LRVGFTDLGECIANFCCIRCTEAFSSILLANVALGLVIHDLEPIYGELVLCQYLANVGQGGVGGNRLYKGLEGHQVPGLGLADNGLKFPGHLSKGIHTVNHLGH
jgi:hypothetical protein